MSKVKVAAFTVSLDGFGAGLKQDLQNPLGVGGENLHSWLIDTEVFKKMQGEGNGRRGIDNDFAAQSMNNVGAWIMGRNMFGPVRGPWKDESWKGWWGEEPPYHTPVFILTHHARAPLTMEGGTTFHFVTAGIEPALKEAKDAAKGKDVRIGGGVATIRQYLSAGLIDEVHLALSPIFLGKGEHLFAVLDLHALGFTSIKTVAGEKATHVMMTKR